LKFIISGPVIKIPETPRRELIGMKLSEKATADMRKRLGRTPKSSALSHLTPKQRLTSPMLSRASALSPAAKNLLQRSLKSPSAKSLMKGLSSDYKLKKSYNSPLLCKYRNYNINMLSFFIIIIFNIIN